MGARGAHKGSALRPWRWVDVLLVVMCGCDWWWCCGCKDLGLVVVKVNGGKGRDHRGSAVASCGGGEGFGVLVVMVVRGGQGEGGG
jgi:hypothetical protein